LKVKEAKAMIFLVFILFFFSHPCNPGKGEEERFNDLGLLVRSRNLSSCGTYLNNSGIPVNNLLELCGKFP
jgi:hypothetical protein